VRLGDHAGDGEAEPETVARPAGREERLDGLAQDLRRHALAAIRDSDPAGGAGGALDARQLGDDDRAGRRGVARVGEQVRDGGLELARVDQDCAADAEAQFENPLGTERLLEERQPVGQHLMGVETLHARRADAGERLQLPGKTDAAFQADAGHADDRAARGRRIGETIDAVGKDLQDVRELVTDHGCDAAQRLDVADPVESFGADLRSRRPQPVRKCGQPIGLERRVRHGGARPRRTPEQVST
jgi:hypothetical protein